jgi:hypothetical protein
MKQRNTILFLAGRESFWIERNVWFHVIHIVYVPDRINWKKNLSVTFYQITVQWLREIHWSLHWFFTDEYLLLRRKLHYGYITYGTGDKHSSYFIKYSAYGKILQIEVRWLENIWKEAAVACFKLLPLRLGETKESRKKISVEVIGPRAIPGPSVCEAGVVTNWPHRSFTKTEFAGQWLL